MADLKPIGSERLTGQEKLNRIMEIARYKESSAPNLNETSTKEFSINLSDGIDYQIVKEKQGYIIKKTISESQTDYIEPMKNRKYFSSYSQALKKLNLMAKELNRVNENEEGISMFGEQKKFVLKTPKAAEPEMTPPAPPVEPPAVPEPELPPSPESEAPMPDMAPDTDAMGDEGMDMAPDTDAMGDEGMGAPSGEEVTFKMIQKLTGKLTQKIREYEGDKGLTSENIKYVINMVLSSLDLANLSEEDKEDVLSKFESDEDMDMGDDDMGSEAPEDEDITSDTEVEDIQSSMDVPVESEMGESDYGVGAIMDSIFGESKVDKVISRYFELSDSEKKLQEEKNLLNKEMRKKQFAKQINSIKNLSESIEQELSSKKFLEENKEYTLIGKTNKKNLVFENKKGQIKITPEGLVI
jgi:hypothetical protein